ncbi:hypothetical protein CY35_17G054900 [Sphagnum magellanicum]|nr:hypothetical protein CY35_17G054900 [Sphagnum magellanicum]
MLISLYGSQVLEMGLFYLQVLKASPLLVKEIKVQNLGEPGPVLTSFAKHPVIWILAEQRLIFYSHIQCERFSGR